jgi:hypothetical protein
MCGVVQGSLSNRWLCSTLNALAARPDILKRIIVSDRQVVCSSEIQFTSICALRCAAKMRALLVYIKYGGFLDITRTRSVYTSSTAKYRCHCFLLLLLMCRHADIGLYTLKFYKQGAWRYVHIDDAVPCTRAGMHYCLYALRCDYHCSERYHWVAFIVCC